MTTAKDIIATLEAEGVILIADGDRLLIDSPKGWIAAHDDLIRQLRQHKAAIIGELRQQEAVVQQDQRQDDQGAAWKPFAIDRHGNVKHLDADEAGRLAALFDGNGSGVSVRVGEYLIDGKDWLHLIAPPPQGPRCPWCGLVTSHGPVCGDIAAQVEVPFGRHKGEKVIDMDDAFLKWLAKQGIDPDIAAAIRMAGMRKENGR